MTIAADAADFSVADATATIRFFRKSNGWSDYEVLDKKGRLRIIRQPSPWSFTATLWERGSDILGSVAH